MCLPSVCVRVCVRARVCVSVCVYVLLVTILATLTQYEEANEHVDDSVNTKATGAALLSFRFVSLYSTESVKRNLRVLVLIN